MASLSPWSNSGLGYGMGLYRPRRPSYTYATQSGGRQRTESYRYAVRKSTDDPEDQSDYIDVTAKRNRKESYLTALRPDGASLELKPVEIKVEEPEENHVSQNNEIANRRSFLRTQYSEEHIQELKAALAVRTKSLEEPEESKDNDKNLDMLKNKELLLTSTCNDTLTTLAPEQHSETPVSEQSSNVPSIIVFTYKKNLVFLCISFIMLFSAFRAIQNLQSSMNDEGHLGIIAMACVHGSMFLTCLWAPSLINVFSAKWAIVCGMFSFLTWIGANFHPAFYTLIPTALLSGWGQGILWTAEISYILKLAFDTSKISKNGIDKEMFRFHGIFLACFQTTHIWGNLISSVVISSAEKKHYPAPKIPTNVSNSDNLEHCGVLYPCSFSDSSVVDLRVHKFPVLWKLMCAYLVLGFVGFCLIFFCLDRIGARVYPEKSGIQIVKQHLRLMCSHKTFRLLIPLLIFSGVQQGFMFSDFNKAYITCSLGVQYVGYCMIVMGVSNVISAFLVALFARHVPREVVFGIGGIIHIGIMIGVQIWIPDKENLSIHFVVAASWGICDAVWQTQCNTLICVTCPDEADVAFANYRMLQSMGLMFSFLCGLFMCISSKLYFLVAMLVISIAFYVYMEYKVRQEEASEDNVEDVFEEPHSNGR
ncbi:hypothetical protein FSP39_017862 [Pinctada imbricata]|uniref:Uncharacterized protein n=1 Tax=Pinctada imbricata TaxID=66713 RepID=A0AA88Y9W1_PINIB|nr:hypothetical protein FSP39_017862 [Pinctada imbricata]